MTGRYLKKLAGLSLGCAMVIGAASAANATTYTLGSYSMVSNESQVGTVHDTTSNPLINENANIGPIKLNMTADGSGGAAVSFTSFCVDIFDTLKNGGGWTISSGLGALGLGNTKTAQLTNLLYSADAYISTVQTGTGTITDRGTAMQIAIWEIINEQSAGDITATNYYSASSGNFYINGLPSGSLALTDANTLLSHLSAAAAPASFSVSLISAAGNQTQVIYQNGAASLTGAVPEPATWGMMVLGFGVLGAALRRKRDTANVIA